MATADGDGAAGGGRGGHQTGFAARVRIFSVGFIPPVLRQKSVSNGLFVLING